MKKGILFILIWLTTSIQTSHAQDKPLQLSLGTVRTELKQNAIDFGVKYGQSLDSLFQYQDILFSGKNSLFQLTPEFDVRSGTSDAFSSIDAKLSGLIMFFQNTEVAGLVTPCTDCYMHLMPVSIGVETNNTFTVVNGILEVGYVPWYQSPMMKKIPQWMKHSKIGVFFQAGYKFNTDTSRVSTNGGQVDESKEALGEGILRLKGSVAIDTKSLFDIGGVGLGLWGSADGWYDFLNNEIYYRFQGTLRFFLTQNKDKYFNINYQKGSGAPNFNQGDQFGMGLTIAF